MQTNCILITSNFVIHRQIVILSMFNIASLSRHWLQIQLLSKCCPSRWIPRWLLTNTPVTSAVTNFLCHRLITKVN